LKKYLGNSSVKDLPYIVRLNSDNLYQPSAKERDDFFKWLENQIQTINGGKPSGWRWTIDEPHYGHGTTYSTSYPIHKPAHKNDTKSEYVLTISGPIEIDSLELDIVSYGTLNL
jgi:hypothetical protein